MPKITGAGRVTVKLKTLGASAIRTVGPALFAAGEIIEKEAAHSITEGAVSGKNHVPSLPGEAPNEQWGGLRTHIETTRVAPLQVQVSSNASYSVPLEFGTSKMAARPFMGPALRRKKNEVVALVRQAVSKAIEG
jgi:HK97 gp10 family phage protein